MVFCSKCGTEYTKKKKFCPKCGAKFKEKSKTKIYITSIGIFLIGLIIAVIFISKSNIPQIVELNEKLVNLGVNTENLGFFSDKGVSSGSTLEETSYCGDGVCGEDESCKTCIKDCGDCRITERKQESYCGDGTCDIGECQSRCTTDCTVSDCQDGICDLGMGEVCDNSPDCQCDPSTRCEQKRCVTFCGNKFCENDEKTCDANRCIEDCGVCTCIELGGVVCKSNQICSFKYDLRAQDTSSCCLGLCKQNPELYPIIFVHGHSRTNSDSPNMVHSFDNMKFRFAQTQGYMDRGILYAGSISQYGSWKEGTPMVSTSYYINSNNQLSDDQDVPTYSQRLGSVVDKVLQNTQSDKVKIVAHSMGGLVTRYYLKYGGGTEKVHSVILIGTPNHGIFGDVGKGCEGIFGRTTESPECLDMVTGSLFLNNLNSVDETPGSINYLTIDGTVGQIQTTTDPCGDGSGLHDEVVCSRSVPLSGAKSLSVAGHYVSGADTLHSQLIDPDYTPEVYSFVEEFIKKN